jgi:hypothetical protein
MERERPKIIKQMPDEAATPPIDGMMNFSGYALSLMNDSARQTHAELISHLKRCPELGYASEEQNHYELSGSFLVRKVCVFDPLLSLPIPIFDVSSSFPTQFP